MANNWAPPPPPPPPGPPPPSNGQPVANGQLAPAQNQWGRSSAPPQAISQDLADKNAAFLAKMRAKQAKRASYNPPPQQQGQKINLLGSPIGHNNGQKKISLFGDGFLKNAQIQNNVAATNAQYANNNAQNQAAKKKSKYVELPPTGLTEKQLFTKYKIESEKKIGAGAFARIKLVKGVSDGTRYALKMVKKKGKSRSDIEAFKKEILYLSKLTNHPNIIKMYDFCDSPQGLYMVLEFCNGGNVMEHMELVKAFKENEAKHIVKQLVAGLCYFHEHNIVHRDLKLDNLMYNNGILKIIDFGLAGDCTDNPLNTPCGTIHFTAPEVLSSYDYTTAADIWSLGVIIYLLITGFPPFFDNQGNEQKLFQIIKKAKFNFIPMYFDECEPCLKELISDCLRKRPIERLTAQEARISEWLTGVKPPPRKKPAIGPNPFLDDDNKNGKKDEVYNPFLNNNDNDNKPKSNLPPFMQYQQAQKAARAAQQNKANLPPYMQFQQKQQQQNAPPPPGPPPGAAPGAVQPGSAQPGAPGANSQPPPPGGPPPGQYQQRYGQQPQQQQKYGQYQQYGQQRQYQQGMYGGAPPPPK